MVLWMMFLLMQERMWRRQYETERANPEWFDFGGEA